MKYFYLVFFFFGFQSIFVSNAHAQSSPFPPCIDYRGIPVQVMKTTSGIGGPAFSTWDKGGTPLIVFNSRLMDSISHSPSMTFFVYEHECGHHVLGHITGVSDEVSSHAQMSKELDADCYAAHKLREMNYSVDEITQVIDDIYPWPKDPEHPSGKVRAKHVIACYEGKN